MRLAKGILLGVMIGLAGASAAGAAGSPAKAEYVTGGVLDLLWIAGYNTPRDMVPATLDPSDPAYANPSGDHTVAVAVNTIPDSGGIIVTCVPAGGLDDYLWQADVFCGSAIDPNAIPPAPYPNTRRGLVFRADPATNYTAFYQFVIDAGWARFRLRKFVASSTIPTTLLSWLVSDTPVGFVSNNTWHKMGVIATGDRMRCFFDGIEVTPAGGVQDPSSPLLTGDVGAYNFSATTGLVPAYFDNLELYDLATPAEPATWGKVKSLYR